MLSQLSNCGFANFETASLSTCFDEGNRSKDFFIGIMPKEFFFGHIDLID
jgi:hypothetical protein